MADNNKDPNELEAVEMTDTQTDSAPEAEGNAQSAAESGRKDAATRKDDKKDVKKSAKSRKSGMLVKTGGWLRNVRGEMKRVVWPSKKQVLNNTGAVLAFMLLAAVAIGLFDSLLSMLIKMFFGS